jgi:hypothetical protein
MENYYEDNTNIEADPIEDPITDTDFDEDDRMDHDFPGMDRDFEENNDEFGGDDFEPEMELSGLDGGDFYRDDWEDFQEPMFDE